MKKIATLLLSLALFTYTSYADDKPIDYEQLPAAAKAFVQAEFPSAAISFVTRDSDLLDTTYDLHFADGLKVEFNSKGEWKEISRKSSPIDDRFVPQKIRENVASRWPDARFRKIERYRQGYEVELSNGLELKYNKNFKLAEIDD